MLARNPVWASRLFILIRGIFCRLWFTTPLQFGEGGGVTNACTCITSQLSFGPAVLLWQHPWPSMSLLMFWRWENSSDWPKQISSNCYFLILQLSSQKIFSEKNQKLFCLFFVLQPPFAVEVLLGLDCPSLSSPHSQVQSLVHSRKFLSFLVSVLFPFSIWSGSEIK